MFIIIVCQQQYEILRNIHDITTETIMSLEFLLRRNFKLADASAALVWAAGSGHLDVVKYLAGERGAIDLN